MEPAASLPMQPLPAKTTELGQELGTGVTEAGCSISPKLAHTGDASTPQANRTPPHQEEEGATYSLLPDDINFPRLPSPHIQSPSPKEQQWEGHSSPNPQMHTPQPRGKLTTPTFVWGPKPVQEDGLRPCEEHRDKSKSKSTKMDPDPTPITRQGYRMGRLAEDFWTALSIPNLPPSPGKTLQVIPFLTKNHLSEQAEYLVDTKTTPPSAIIQVHVAELIAGIPWTPSRARQHVVNEISQALHKVLTFNNTRSNPFQKWQQGNWFAHWGDNPEGEPACILFVCIAVTEQKVKPRKGQHFRWQQLPEEIRSQLRIYKEDDITSIQAHQPWHNMAGTMAPRSHPNTASSNVEASSFTADIPPTLHAR